jgi:hypothetical protein
VVVEEGTVDVDVDVDEIDDREDGSEVDVPLDATANGVGTVDEVPPGAIVLTELCPLPPLAAVVLGEDGAVVEEVSEITNVTDAVPVIHWLVPAAVARMVQLPAEENVRRPVLRPTAQPVVPALVTA